jgi:transposase
MREPSRIDSFMGAGMPNAYSCDLRERVIAAVEAGASRREAAERFEVSVASAVKWLQRWYEEKSASPKPRGGRISPLEEFCIEILDLITRSYDMQLSLAHGDLETEHAAPASRRPPGLRSPVEADGFARTTRD